MLPAADSQLVQIIDAATADAARRSGHWLLCKPGCTQCCIGVFAISQLDAIRLRQGLVELERTDPARAQAVRQRTHEAVSRLASDFPGDVQTGTLYPENEAFEDFANDEPCPVLDPQTGLCDLYSSRPMTCRVFGPPIRTEEGIGICELCFVGANEKEIEAGALHLDCEDLEARVTAEAEQATGFTGSTIVAFALIVNENAGAPGSRS